MRSRWLAATVILGFIATLATGCGAGDERGPRAVASRFADALSSDDAAAACGLLAPETKSELEQSAGKKCAAAILAEDLPDAGTVAQLAAFGTMAQVSFVDDVMFLTEFRSGWKVMAAGCSPVPGRPYDCQLQGG
ncbi:MAG: hypothetical protein JWR85_3093 [Marmoricola sp.]|nr:hypothetical protein [Marmoricola sp.]